jgi:ribulose 1,5-bisphosphate carboxylase large subunit-like protein
VTALKQAWAAAIAGVPVDVAARTQRELREALATFRA